MSIYEFEKLGSIIQRPLDMPAPGPYYTSIIETKDLPHWDFNYALYFSTDHHRGLGGIWLYLNKGDPTNPKDWISYDEALQQGYFKEIPSKPEKNPIFVDDVQGMGHTETAHINRVNDEIIMTYHKDKTGHTQATLLATSSDGLLFHRINGQKDSIVLNYDITVDPGNGHTGYFRWAKNSLLAYSNPFCGYSLHGGGDKYYSALWSSKDGKKWTREKILEPIEGNGLQEDDKLIIWHELDPNSFQKIGENEFACLCAIGNRASGATKRISEIYEIYVQADGVTLTRPATSLLKVGAPSEDDSEELASPCLFYDNDTPYLIYVGAKECGSENTIMIARGKVHLQGKLPPPYETAKKVHIIS